MRFLQYKYQLIVSIAIIMTLFDGYSQKNFTLYHLNETAQANYLNPGFKQKNRVYISLPIGMQSISVLNTGFKMSDVLKSRPQDDSLTLTPSLAISKMNKTNFFNMEMSNELLGVGFKIKKDYFSINITNRFQSRVTYPKDLFQFATEGNGKNFLGKRASFDGLGIDLMSYVEYGIGYNKDVNDKLTVGGRVKFLSGIANVQTKKSQFGITTDASSFDITVDGSMQVNTSNLDSNSIKNSNQISSSFFNFKNSGIALDLGASYQLTDKIQLSSSLLDLGFITWKSNATTYTLKDVNYTFKGLDLNSSDSLSSQQIQDTLENIFKQNPTHQKYTTALHTKFYIGGKYEINKTFSASALLYNEIVASHYSAGISIAANAKVNKWLYASVNYSAYGRAYNTVGLGFNLKGGPVQFYFMADNIIGFLKPMNAKHLHLTTGLNIVIGPKKEKNKEEKSEEVK